MQGLHRSGERGSSVLASLIIAATLGGAALVADLANFKNESQLASTAAESANTSKQVETVDDECSVSTTLANGTIKKHGKFCTPTTQRTGSRVMLFFPEYEVQKNCIPDQRVPDGVCAVKICTAEHVTPQKCEIISQPKEPTLNDVDGFRVNPDIKKASSADFLKSKGLGEEWMNSLNQPLPDGERINDALNPTVPEVLTDCASNPNQARCATQPEAPIETPVVPPTGADMNAPGCSRISGQWYCFPTEPGDIQEFKDQGWHCRYAGDSGGTPVCSNAFESSTAPPCPDGHVGTPPNCSKSTPTTPSNPCTANPRANGCPCSGAGMNGDRFPGCTPRQDSTFPPAGPPPPPPPQLTADKGPWGQQTLGQPAPGNQTPQAPGTCPAGQTLCSGNTLYSRNNQCVDTVVQYCQYGCAAQQQQQSSGTNVLSSILSMFGGSGSSASVQSGQCAPPPQQGGNCPQAPAQPTSECTNGQWKPTYGPPPNTTNTAQTGTNSNTCVVGWQCVPTGSAQLSAELSCQPKIGDVGMNIAVSYSCSAGTSEGSGFSTDGARSGATTITLTKPPGNTNTATYTLTCTDGAQIAKADCSVQVAKASIVLIANPEAVRRNETSRIGWITSGMKSCVISSPDDDDFTEENEDNTNVNGTAVSEPLRDSTDFILTCETQGGATKEQEIRVNVI